MSDASRVKQEAEQKLTTAIGHVVRTSAHAVMALEMIGGAVSGDEDYFGTRGLVDQTMGRQLAVVRDELAAAPETPWIEHARAAVAELAELRPYRNRVVHDSWSVMPREDDPLAVWAVRAALLGSPVVKTSVRALWALDGLLFAAAASLQHTSDALNAHAALTMLDEEERGGGRDHGSVPPDLVDFQLEGELSYWQRQFRDCLYYRREAAKRFAAWRAGELPGWRWEEEARPVTTL